MKTLYLFCLILCFYGCGSEPQGKLSDEKFLALFADVMELHRYYPFDPDSVMIKRKTMFKSHGVTPADIEQFLMAKRDNPKEWDPLLVLLEKRFGKGARPQMKSFEKTRPDSTKKTGQQ